MVTAILRLLEQDGTVYPPRTVTIIGPCPSHVGGGCIQVRTADGDDIYCTPDELEAVEVNA